MRPRERSRLVAALARGVAVHLGRTGHLGRLGQASFRDLVADCDERIQIVVRFLALLELYRDGKVDLAQAATFGEIDVRWEGEAA